MLKLYYSLGQLSFGKLMKVYEEGNLENARQEHPDLPVPAAMQMAEQAFYQYLKEVFFSTSGSLYAVWEDKGCYCSALRLEPYRDGLLLAALETAPTHRKKGYGEKLVRSVLAEMGNQKIYSHVSKTNTASLNLHSKCGFRRISESAVYLDGSVNSKCCTLCYEP